MRYLYTSIGLFLLLAATATAGSFKVDMDVDSYMDAGEANQSFSESDTIWATSENGEPVREVYLSFVNLFGSQGVFKPEQIESATLTINAAEVETPGEVTAYLVHNATLDTNTWADKPEYLNDVSESLNVEDTGSYTLDVTSLIQKAVETCTEGCPYSIALVAEDNASVGFTSAEASEEDAPALEYETAE